MLENELWNPRIVVSHITLPKKEGLNFNGYKTEF